YRVGDRSLALSICWSWNNRFSTPYCQYLAFLLRVTKELRSRILRAAPDSTVASSLIPKLCGAYPQRLIIDFVKSIADFECSLYRMLNWICSIGLVLPSVIRHSSISIFMNA